MSIEKMSDEVINRYGYEARKLSSFLEWQKKEAMRRQLKPIKKS